MLDLPSRNVHELRGSLSIDERTKAERFRFERDRSRFIAARGILRLILGCYLSVEPNAVLFCYERNGKPRLQNTFTKTGIQFNLSHSERLALYVFARDHEVGVDIERIRDFPGTEQMVEQFFSARERVAFHALSGSEKQETFFSWWTRKEAFVKATGYGLSYPIDTFDVSGAPGKSVELRIVGDAEEASEWSVGDVNPAEEFAGAVAVEGRDWEVQCWQWPEQSKRNWIQK